MLDFVKCTTCRRENILTFFDDIGENSEVISKHLCCDICENDCQCGETECHGNTESMTFLMSKVTEPTSNLHVRDVTESGKEELRSLLKECQEEMRQEFQQSNLHCLYSSIDQLTCFSDSLLNETIDNCDKRNSVESILETLSVWNADHAIKIFDCLKKSI